MFSKKVLGLVGLLFIGSKVKAGVFQACDDIKEGKGECVPTSGNNYCIGESETFYRYDENCIHVADDVFVLNESNEEVNTIENGSSGLHITYCNGISCVDTKGYVKNGDNYFLIKSDAASSANLVPVATATSCDGNVGKLVSVTDTDDIYLCLTENKSVQLNDNSEGSYLVSSSGDLDLTAKDNTKYVITKKPNVLLVNKLYSTSGEPECYDSTNASIMPRIDNFCEGANCAKYYKCNNGECTLQTSSCPRGDEIVDGSGTTTPTCDPTKEEDNNCAEGYYLYSEGLKVKDKEEGTLYHCEKEVATGAKKRTETGSIKCTDVKQIPTGYFKNTAYDSAAAAEDRENHNAQYIKCTVTAAGTATCEAITVVGETCNDGLVYKDGDNIRLCLDSGRSISIQLTGYNANDKDYFIKVSGTGNIFGSGDNYTLVTVNKESVVKSSNSDTALYKYAGDSYEVLERSAGICNYDGTLYEFGLICSDENGYDSSTVYYIFKDSKEVTEA